MTPFGNDGEDEGEDEPVKPLIPHRAATPQQAIMAVAFVFFLGIAVGFALAQAL